MSAMDPNPLDDVNREALSPVLLLERTLRVFPERVGLIHRDETWTWHRFSEEVSRLAGALRRADELLLLAPEH